MKKNTKYILIGVFSLLFILFLAGRLVPGTIVFDPDTRQTESNEFTFTMKYENGGDDTDINYIGTYKTGLKPIYVCDTDYDDNMYQPGCYNYIFDGAQSGDSLEMTPVTENIKSFNRRYSLNEYLDYKCIKRSGYIEDDGRWDDDEQYQIDCVYYLRPEFIEIQADRGFMPQQKYFSLDSDAEIEITVHNNLFGFSNAGYIIDYYAISGIQRDIEPEMRQKSLPRGRTIITVPLKTDEESVLKTDIPFYVEIKNQRIRLDKYVSFNYVVGEHIYESHKHFIEYPEIIGDDGGVTDTEPVCSDFVYNIPSFIGQEPNCETGTIYGIIALIIGGLIIVKLLKK